MPATTPHKEHSSSPSAGKNGSVSPSTTKPDNIRARLVAIAALEDAKSEDVIVIDMMGKSALADTMIIASGRSNRHVASIAHDVIQAMKDHHLGTPRIEGIGAADWVLVDQGDVIVHIFRPEVRSFYNLEKLWQTPEIDVEAPKKADKKSDAVH